MFGAPCEQCGGPLEPGHGTGRFCYPCGDQRQRESRKRSRERRRLGLAPAVRRADNAHLQRLAQAYVRYATSKGLLPPLSDGRTRCVDCGGVAHEWEHRNYWTPVDVQPVCRSCNHLRGSAVNKFPRAA